MIAALAFAYSFSGAASSNVSPSSPESLSKAQRREIAEKAKANFHVLYRKQEYDQALSELTAAIKLKPKDTNLYSFVALCYERKQEYGKESATLVQLISIDPECFDAYGRLAVAYEKLGKEKLMEPYWKQAESLSTDAKRKALFYVARAYAAHAQMKWSTALECARTAVNLDPGLWNAHYALADVYQRVHRYEKAAVEFEKACSLESNQNFARLRAGECYMTIGQFEKALPLLEKAVQYEPTNYLNLCVLGETYQMAGKLEKAMECYNKAIDLNPSYGKGFILRGAAKRRMGDNRGALADYDQGLKTFPAVHYFLARGKLLLDLKQYKRAIDDFTKVIAGRGENMAAAYFARAKARAALGKKDLADMDNRTGEMIVESLLPFWESQYDLQDTKK